MCGPNWRRTSHPIGLLHRGGSGHEQFYHQPVLESAVGALNSPSRNYNTTLA